MAPGPGLNMLGCLSEPASSSGGSKYVCNGDVCVLSHTRNPAKKEKPNPWFSFGCRSSKACATSIQLARSHPSPASRNQAQSRNSSEKRKRITKGGIRITK